MCNLYTKLVEVNPGDTIVHENGERWEAPANFQYILVKESTIIERTGSPVVRIPEEIRNLLKKAKKARESR